VERQILGSGKAMRPKIYWKGFEPYFRSLCEKGEDILKTMKETFMHEDGSIWNAVGFKRAQELGLEPKNETKLSYALADIHKMLAKSIQVYCSDVRRVWLEDSTSDSKSVGLLIGIKPLIKESDEKILLRKLVEQIQSVPLVPYKERAEQFSQLETIIETANEFLRRP
jgi:hypothetical protein